MRFSVERSGKQRSGRSDRRPRLVVEVYVCGERENLICILFVAVRSRKKFKIGSAADKERFFGRSFAAKRFGNGCAVPAVMRGKG